MLPGMADRLLGREQDAAADEDRNDQRGADAAEVESVVREWLGEQVSHRRAQRTNEDEGQPEQQGARNLRAEVGGRDERQRAGKEVVTRARGRPSSSRISRFGQTNQPHKTIARELASFLGAKSWVFEDDHENDSQTCFNFGFRA
jgi:hypothetical protein